MEIKELRIGNIIKFSEDGTIFEVGSIETNGFTVQNEYETTWIETECFEPIPLTEEWLLKLGFELKTNNSPQTFQKIGQYNFKVKKWKSNLSGVDLSGCNNLGRKIKYVHQLQNLYFALTNQELTWK